MEPGHIKELLFSEIEKVSKSAHEYCIDPDKNFTRNRKLSFESMLKKIIGLGGGSLSNELLNMSGYSADAASSSAFVQQRSKIKAEALKSVLTALSKRLSENFPETMRILTVDGSHIQIAANPDDSDSYVRAKEGRKPYNLLHLNAMYDLKHSIYIDADIQKIKNLNEHQALNDMVDRSDIPSAIVIADRGYESYNNMAHIQEKGWKFLIRAKDGGIGIKSGLVLPSTNTFDMDIELNLTRKMTNETRTLFQDKNSYKHISSSHRFDYLPPKRKKADPVTFYKLKFRIVRFQISENAYETVLTNLDPDAFPPEKLKELYAMRWGIETSFRKLKYTVGMLHFHARKIMLIEQEIYAHMVMYNFMEMATSYVTLEKKQRKYAYKANFAIAAHICRLFFIGLTTLSNLKAVISRNLIPVRPDRHNPRNLTVNVFRGFLYRPS